MSRRKSARVGITLLALCLTVVACGSIRPTVSEWESEWNSVVALIPDQSFLDDDPAEACENVLVSLREAEEDLFPTPDELIDDTVRRWFDVAEGTFFDCPPFDGGFPASFEMLDELEAEVEASLTS